jgi:hypothetical protein
VQSVTTRARSLALRWGLLAGLWLVLVDSRRWQELAVGGLAAALAAALGPAIVRPGAAIATPASVFAVGARRLLAPLWRLVRDIAPLTRALGDRLRGRGTAGSFRAARYAPDAPRRSAAGRALTELWGSTQANRYVIGVDEDDQTILIHELVSSDEPIDPLPLR